MEIDITELAGLSPAPPADVYTKGEVDKMIENAVMEFAVGVIDRNGGSAPAEKRITYTYEAIDAMMPKFSYDESTKTLTITTE